VDVGVVQETLRKAPLQVQPLVGRDLSALLLGERPTAAFDAAQCFMADDEMSRGNRRLARVGLGRRPHRRVQVRGRLLLQTSSTWSVLPAHPITVGVFRLIASMARVAVRELRTGSPAHGS
jgi:hypothetical protein